MDRWIENLVEPKRLILAWQAPDAEQNRSRWAAGELARDGTTLTFRYYAGDEFARMNGKRSPDEMRAAGFLGYPAFTWKAGLPITFETGVLEAFLRRVPTQSRSDFPQYLEGFRLRPRRDLPPMALLGATGAALPGDGFTLVDPLDPKAGVQDVMLEVAGYRHYAAQTALRLGDALELAPAPGEGKDPHAVQVRSGREVAGYVNRLQSEAVTGWLATRNVQAWVAKVNGPVGQPRAHMLVAARQEALAPAA